jgi:hypothetical protein
MRFSPSRCRFRACLAAMLILLAAAPGADSGDTAEQPLTDEDVVRMVVMGTPAADIVDRIRDSEVAFDLSDEMVGELRAAGIPNEIIQAMKERQRELDAERAPSDAEPAEAAAPEPPMLRIRLNPGWKPDEDQPRPRIRLLDTIDPATYENLRLRGTAPQFTNVALVLLCRTQDHVPDHWRSKSPLGRDFVFTPRHKLLAFLPGVERKELGKLQQLASELSVVPGQRGSLPVPGVLTYEIPESIEVPLEPGVIHDLTLGLAVQAEDRYFLVAADDRDETTLPEEGLDVEAEVSGGQDKAIESLAARFLPPGTAGD